MSAESISPEQIQEIGAAFAARFRDVLRYSGEGHDLETLIAEGIPYEALDVLSQDIVYDAVDPLGRRAYTLSEVVRLDLRAKDRDLLALAQHRPADLVAAINAAAGDHRVRAIHTFSITGGVEILMTPLHALAAAAAQGRRPAPAQPRHAMSALFSRMAAVRAAVVQAGVTLDIDAPTAPSSPADIQALEDAVGSPLPAPLVEWLGYTIPGFDATVRPRKNGAFAFVGWFFADADGIRGALAEKRESWVSDDEDVRGPYVSPAEARALLEGCIPLSVWESFFFLTREGAVCFYEEGGLVRGPLAPDLHTFLEQWSMIGFFSQREYDAYLRVLGDTLQLPPKDEHALIYALS